MSAVLNNQNNIEKMLFLYGRVPPYGYVEVLGPDVNESSVLFTVNKSDDKIRFGLAGIKGVGDKAVESIIEERERQRTVPIDI